MYKRIAKQPGIHAGGHAEWSRTSVTRGVTHGRFFFQFLMRHPATARTHRPRERVDERNHVTHSDLVTREKGEVGWRHTSQGKNSNFSFRGAQHERDEAASKAGRSGYGVAKPQDTRTAGRRRHMRGHRCVVDLYEAACVLCQALKAEPHLGAAAKNGGPSNRERLLVAASVCFLFGCGWYGHQGYRDSDAQLSLALRLCAPPGWCVASSISKTGQTHTHVNRNTNM